MRLVCLAVVIGQRCVAVPAEDVAGLVLGHTAADDLTTRDI